MMKNKKIWKKICIFAVIVYTLKNLLIGTDTDEGYGIMVGYRLAMGDRLLLDMWEPHQTSAIFTALFIGPSDRRRELPESVFKSGIFPDSGRGQCLPV